MKKVCLSVLLMLIVAGAYAQITAPSWTNTRFREGIYSTDDYFTGYVTGNIRSNENRTQAIERVKSDAQAELVQSIRVLVQTDNQKSDQQLQSGENFLFRSLYNSAVRTWAQEEIVGVKLEAYFDPKEELVYGFAYLEREVMIRYYQNQIALNLKKVADAINNTKLLSEQGAKVKARQVCKEAIACIANIEYSQDVLTAVDRAASESSLYLNEISALRQELVSQTSKMLQNFLLHIRSFETNFGTTSTLLSNRLKSILSENGYQQTNDTLQADMGIVIHAATREHDNQQSDLKFAYADIVLKIVDLSKNIEVYVDEFSVKGGALTTQSAGKNALEESSKTIYEKINLWIE